MHELIVGGAGSGKTTELKRRYSGSQNALFLSSDGPSPYKLALDIVSAVEGRVPEPDRAEYIGEKKSVFASKRDYEKRLALGAPVSLCGEVMKSFGECEIANFLFEARIDYIYEHPYKIDTASAEFSRYRPDFYLPKYDVYIEYFALDREGRAPAHFSDSAAYERGVEWKKALHGREGTRLISLYAYEREEGRLVESLKKALKSFRIKLYKRRRGELYPKDAVYAELGGVDFAPIIKRAADYVRKGEYRCTYSHIFVDDIDLMEKELADLILSLGVPVTASARSEVIKARLTRLGGKYRAPEYIFSSSHTKKGVRKEVLRYLGSLPEGARAYVIAKSNAIANELLCEHVSFSYDREDGSLKLRLLSRADLMVRFVSAERAEGRECEYAAVLSDSFSDGDKRVYETALTRAKRSVFVISTVGGECDMVKGFRESFGGEKPKKGFLCPRCGAELRVVKGRYGDFLGCRSCDYKRKM